MALLVSDSHQAEAFKLLTDGDDTERLVPLHRYNAEDEALRLATIHVATCYSWLLLPDNDIFEVIHQVLYFVQTSAVAGCYQCTAVSLATNEASTETFNDASAGETLLTHGFFCWLMYAVSRPVTYAALRGSGFVG